MSILGGKSKERVEHDGIVWLKVIWAPLKRLASR